MNSDALPKDGMDRHPSVDPAPVVADLESRALNGFDEVQVFPALHLAEHDIPDLQLFWEYWHHGAQLAGFDFTGHRIAAGTERDGFARLQLCDISCCPTHA